jgi:hypothetical protein
MRLAKLIAAGAVLLVLALVVGDGGNSSAANAPAATNVVYPVMDVGTGCFLGGVSAQKFVTDTLAAPTVKGGESYRLYSLKGYVGKATGGKPESLGVPCDATVAVPLKPSQDGKDVIALGGTWAGMPRVPKALDPAMAVYRQATADLLKARGITNPKLNVTQVYRIDLEGDKVDEVIVAATYYAGAVETTKPGYGPTPDAQAGDYSVVYMRKVVGGRVQTTVLAADIYPEAKEFIAPAEYRIRGILDVNGDGTMEVIVYGRYYEGHWSSVFQVKGTKVEEVLSCGCGA